MSLFPRVWPKYGLKTLTSERTSSQIKQCWLLIQYILDTTIRTPLTVNLEQISIALSKTVKVTSKWFPSQLTKEAVDNSKEAACGGDNSGDDFIRPVNFQQTRIQLSWAFRWFFRDKPGNVGHFHRRRGSKMKQEIGYGPEVIGTEDPKKKKKKKKKRFC